MPFEIDPSGHLTVGILSPLRSRFLLFVFDKGKNDRVVFYARQQLCRERERGRNFNRTKENDFVLWYAG